MARTTLTALALAALLAGCAAPIETATTIDAPAAPALACAAACKLALDDGAGEAFEPMIVADPNDPLHLVAGYSEHTTDAAGNTHRWNKAAVSFDGGASWEIASIPGGPSAGPSHPLFAATDMGDASVAILDDGRVVFTGLALNSVTNEFVPAGALTAYSLYAARSTDGGLTYPEVSIIARGRGALAYAPVFIPMVGDGAAAAWSANDKNWVAAGPNGTLLVAWSVIQFPPLDRPGELYALDLSFSSSKDGGKTWTAPARIRDGKYSGAFPAIGADGAWYVAHMAYGEPAVRLATSRDEGKTWETSVIADDGSAWYPNFPNLVARVVDGDERLFVSYVHEDTDAKTETPRLRWSDDGGASWSEPVDLAPPGARIWSQPALAVGADGTAFVSFYRADAEDAPTRYVAVAVKDGVASPPVVVDDGLEGQTGTRGHYTGIAATPDGALATWVSGARGEYDLVGAVLR